MPYDTDSDVPKYIPAGKRSQWREVWNSEYQRQLREGKSAKEAEQIAFASANSAALHRKLSALLSEIPTGTKKLPSDLVVYMELTGAKKDGECEVVDIPRGISLEKGCCDVWDPQPDPGGFMCGTCSYHQRTGQLSGSDMPKDCGDGRKAVGDECVPQSKFAYVGDPGRKDTWKLPIHDESHTQNAMSRFNQTEGIPAGEKSAVAHRIATAARKYGKDLEGFRKRLSEGGVPDGDIMMILGPQRLFATSLHTLGAVVDPGKGLYKIPIAYTGTFYKDGDRFHITEKDLDDIIRNFSERELQEINLDYDHASEMPEVAKGGPIPSAGGIVKVLKETGPDSTPWLFGFVHYTDLAGSLVNTHQYRYFSPAIDWSSRNKHTGKPQGATLTSAALTNRPFLEKLGPLPTLMSETPRILTKETVMPEKTVRIRKVLDEKGNARYEACLMGEGTGDASFGEKLGEIYPNDMEKLGDKSPAAENMTAAPKASPASSSSSTTTPNTAMHASDLEKQLTNVLGEAPLSLSEVRRLYQAGKSSIAASDGRKGHVLLSETFSDHGWDETRGLQLLADNKVTPQQYAAFTIAARKIQKGIDEGKIHPSQAQFFLHDAIDRPAEFDKYLSDALPYIDLSEHGLGGSDPQGRVQASERDRVDHQVRQYMKDNKCKYSVALKAVTRDPKAAQAMRENSGRSRVM